MIKSQFKKQKLTLIFVYAIAIMMVLVNFIRIFDGNFWGDEAFSIRLAKMTVSDMLNATAADVHPPLYYLILMFTYRVVGDYGWMWHIVSIVPFVASCILVVTLVRKKYGDFSAGLLLILWGLSSNAVRYNVEVRMYSWAALFVFLAYWEFGEILLKKKRAYYLFPVFSLLAAYTHYYAMMSVAILYFALLIMCFRKMITIRQIIAIYLGTIIGYLPWLFKMVATFMNAAGGYKTGRIPGIKDGLEYYYYSKHSIYSYGMLLLTIICVFIVVNKDLEIIKITKEDGKLRLKTELLRRKVTCETEWIIWGLITAMGALVIGELIIILITPAFRTKYLYPVLPVMWMVLCMSLSKLRYSKYITVLVLVATLVIYGPMYIKTYSSDRNKDIKCREAQELMVSSIDSDDIILTNNIFLTWTVLDYYLPGQPYGFVEDVDMIFNNCDKDKQYWIAWLKELTKEELSVIEKNGYSVTPIINDGIMGDKKLWLYKMRRN